MLTGVVSFQQLSGVLPPCGWGGWLYAMLWWVDGQGCATCCACALQVCHCLMLRHRPSAGLHACARIVPSICRHGVTSLYTSWCRFMQQGLGLLSAVPVLFLYLYTGANARHVGLQASGGCALWHWAYVGLAVLRCACRRAWIACLFLRGRQAGGCAGRSRCVVAVCLVVACSQLMLLLFVLCIMVDAAVCSCWVLVWLL